MNHTLLPSSESRMKSAFELLMKGPKVTRSPMVSNVPKSCCYRVHLETNSWQGNEYLSVFPINRSIAPAYMHTLALNLSSRKTPIRTSTYTSNLAYHRIIDRAKTQHTFFFPQKRGMRRRQTWLYAPSA